MVISLCGNQNNKKVIIDKLKEIYQDKIIVCNYYVLGFEERINNEAMFYESMKSSNLVAISKQDLIQEYFALIDVIDENRINFNEYVEEKVNKK